MRCEFDYIIVGAGSAGCVLANRLSADWHKEVLLLEAGGRDSDPWIRIPFAWGKILRERRNDWGLNTEPEPALNGRRIDFVRGKVLGGSSSINAMAYVRGHRGDYERWKASGLKRWGYDDVLPYFRRTEHWEDGPNQWRGGDGLLHTVKARSGDPLHGAYLDAVLAFGIPWTDDYNGEVGEGIGNAQHSLRQGRRESGVTSYLAPAKGRPNLTIVTGALAHRIVLEKGRAVGVDYEHRGSVVSSRAAGEVILSAGVSGSPHLLMLSGIGAASELLRHDISVVADLHGVGKNLQDHLSVGVVCRRRNPGPIVSEMRVDRAALNAARAYLLGNGPMSMLPTRYQVFMKSEASLLVPDLQLLAGGATLAARPWFPGIVPPFQDAFSCSAALLHPQSRGHVELASADPHAPIRIHCNYLTDPSDLSALRRGLKIVREIVHQGAFDEFRAAEISPGPDARGDAALDDHIRRNARTVYHPLGTCRMGHDQDAVVDEELRVHGVDGLRIVDASVMPDLISGNINAAVVAIAEKASDYILGRAVAGEA